MIEIDLWKENENNIRFKKFIDSTKLVGNFDAGVLKKKIDNNLKLHIEYGEYHFIQENLFSDKKFTIYWSFNKGLINLECLESKKNYINEHDKEQEVWKKNAIIFQRFVNNLEKNKHFNHLTEHLDFLKLKIEEEYKKNIKKGNISLEHKFFLKGLQEYIITWFFDEQNLIHLNIRELGSNFGKGLHKIAIEEDRKLYSTPRKLILKNSNQKKDLSNEHKKIKDLANAADIAEFPISYTNIYLTNRCLTLEEIIILLIQMSLEERENKINSLVSEIPLQMLQKTITFKEITPVYMLTDVKKDNIVFEVDEKENYKIKLKFIDEDIFAKKDTVCIFTFPALYSKIKINEKGEKQLLATLVLEAFSIISTIVDISYSLYIDQNKSAKRCYFFFLKYAYLFLDQEINDKIEEKLEQDPKSFYYFLLSELENNIKSPNLQEEETEKLREISYTKSLEKVKQFFSISETNKERQETIKKNAQEIYDRYCFFLTKEYKNFLQEINLSNNLEKQFNLTKTK